MKGFTRTEIIILISCAILAGALVSYNILNGRRVMRDVERLATVEQIRNGVERYFVERQEYPTGPNIAIGHGGRLADCVARTCAYLTREEGWTGAPQSELYAVRIPADPSNPSVRCTELEAPEDPCAITYTQLGDDNYAISFYLEGSLDRLPGGKCIANKQGISCG